MDELVTKFESQKCDATAQRATLALIYNGLVRAQDIGDDKLKIVQTLYDLIEGKVKMLEHDAKNLDFENEDDEEENVAPQPPGGRGGGRGSIPSYTSSGGGGGGGSDKAGNGGSAVSKGGSSGVARKRADDKGDKTGKRLALLI